ncbi:MAG TPA: undecaprenyl-phosphate glucose phosphotransferase [Paraburkholderia sp.]|nr:undecaprenyl-phosphate glucose phosphotransferase [Paraburkholderia sp.]
MFSFASRIADFTLMLGGAWLAQRIVLVQQASGPSPVDNLYPLLALALGLLVIDLCGVYRHCGTESATRSAARTLCAWLLAQLIADLCTQGFPDVGLRGKAFAGWALAVGSALALGRYLTYALRRALRRRGYRRTAVALVASGAERSTLAARFAGQRDLAYSLELLFDPALERDQPIDGIPAVTELASFVQLVRAYRIRELWIADQTPRQACIEPLVDVFRDDFINIRVVPALCGRTQLTPGIADCLGLPLLNLVAAPEQGWRALPKAIFDRSFALCALIALAPLLAAIAVAVKCSSPGPVLFRQARKGINGQVFAIYKFRSMYQGADRPGTVTQARRNDARVTRVGRFLRSTSLDELPQFINVLKGDMSVVGPRPHAVEHDEYYKDLVEHYMYRYRIKPGITGWAQVNGYRGETERVEKMAARVMLDIHYIQHWTLWLDLKIVGMTVLKGFAGQSAY